MLSAILACSLLVIDLLSLSLCENLKNTTAIASFLDFWLQPFTSEFCVIELFEPESSELLLRHCKLEEFKHISSTSILLLLNLELLTVGT